MVALDHSGAPDFAALQVAIADGKTRELVFFVFDQMFAGSEDLRPLPLAQRKARLQTAVEQAPANIRYVDHFVTAGDAVLRSACRMDLEGIVQASRRRLPVRPRGQLDEVQVPGGPRGGDRRLHHDRRAFRSLIAGVNAMVASSLWVVLGPASAARSRPVAAAAKGARDR